MIDTQIYHPDEELSFSTNSIARDLVEIGVIDNVHFYQRHDKAQVVGFKGVNPTNGRHVVVFRNGFRDSLDIPSRHQIFYRHTSLEYSSIDFTIQVYKLLIKNGWVIIDYSCPCSDSTQELWKQLAKIDGAQVTICEFGDDDSIISEKVYDGGEFQTGYFLKLSGV